MSAHSRCSPRWRNLFVQLVHQQQRQEAAEDVSGDRRVQSVVDRSRLQQALRRAKQPLYIEKLLVLQGDLLSRQVGVGPQHPLAVVPCFGLD